ncbi:MAG: carbohydrate ABC transporter substrate-binding protein [Ruminococcus sp.]|nr:carbohydrate ABC transporter substrate-binding protein [Ruminococcus sp.]
MKLKTLLASAMLSVFVGSVASGCTYYKPIVKIHTKQTEISFSWWGNDARNEYTINAIKEFERLHPEIKVNCHYSEWSGYQSRSNVQMASNTEADVMQINYAWISQYSPDGYGYYDINKLSEYIDLSNFEESELSYGMKNGMLNAIPIALNTQTVYINKDIYEEYGLEVPKHWNDIIDAAKVMNGKHYPLAMTQKSSWFFATSYVEQMTGKRLMNQNGNIIFTADEFKEMINFYCQLIKNNVIPQVEYFDKLKIENGEYAGVLAWLSDAKGYCETAISNGYEMVPADYTTFENRQLSGWYAKPATMYAISKNTDTPKEAAILLDYLLNSNEMASYQGIEKGIPLSKSTRNYLNKNNMLSGIQYEAFIKMNQFNSSIDVISPFFENEDYIDMYTDACNNVLYEKATLDESAVALYENLTKQK